MLLSERPTSKEIRTKVRVILLTYNHEKWVTEALNSVLMQKTNFSYEVVVVEDCSTDSTRDIVIDFQRRHSDKIHLILSEKNKEYPTHFATAFLTSPSQYIAWLDGDDYWTSPHKLQRQVDFLDTHPDYAICFHNATILYEDGSYELWDHAYGRPKETSTLRDLWAGNFIPGCASMLRKGLFSEFPDWYYSSKWLDWPLYILSAQYGKVGYIDEVMGVYRIHRGGAWSGLSETQQLEELVKFYQEMDANLDFKYNDSVDIHLSRCFEKLARKKTEALEEHLSKREARDNKVWDTLRRALQPHRRSTASVKFVDISLWDPDPEEGRWLAWQVQILNKMLQDREQQLHNLTEQLQSQSTRTKQLENQKQQLRQQLKSIKGSRTWKLAKKLGGLRARMLRDNRGP